MHEAFRILGLQPILDALQGRRIEFRDPEFVIEPAQGEPRVAHLAQMVLDAEVDEPVPRRYSEAKGVDELSPRVGPYPLQVDRTPDYALEQVQSVELYL